MARLALAGAVAPVEAQRVFLDRRYPPARDRALALVALLVHLDDEGIEQRVVRAHALLITGDGEDVLPASAADAVGRLDLLADRQRPQPLRLERLDESRFVAAVRGRIVEQQAAHLERLAAHDLHLAVHALLAARDDVGAAVEDEGRARRGAGELHGLGGGRARERGQGEGERQGARQHAVDHRQKSQGNDKGSLRARVTRSEIRPQGGSVVCDARR